MKTAFSPATDVRADANTSLDVAILLPAYNEAQTIGPTIEAFHKAMPTARIYVINNNSKDSTASIAQDTLNSLSIRGAVLHELRQGKGNAVRRAFLDIDADIYVMADADLTYPAEQIHELIAPIVEERADMVIGDRRSLGDYDRENTRRMHGFGNKLVQYLVNWVAQAEITDIMTGYRALSRTFVKSYPLLVEGFQLETDLSLFAVQSRFRVAEVPIRYVNRPDGSFSKLNTYGDGLRVLMVIFTLFRHYKPLAFFALVALCIALTGGLLGLPVIMEFMETGQILHIPLAILASAVEIVAVVTLGIGLTLDSVAYHRKVDIEKDIQRNTTARYTAHEES